MSKHTDFRAVVLRQKREARALMLALAKLYPGAFDKHARPIVAVLRMPKEGSDE